LETEKNINIKEEKINSKKNDEDEDEFIEDILGNEDFILYEYKKENNKKEDIEENLKKDMNKDNVEDDNLLRNNDEKKNFKNNLGKEKNINNDKNNNNVNKNDEEIERNYEFDEVDGEES